MKNNNIIKSLLIAIAITFGIDAQAQKTIETSFRVDAVCEMCEARIEKAVDVKGVKSADYDLETHTLSIAYSPKTITEGQIHALLNEVGHDTEKSTCTDEQYDRLHGCCKYRTDEGH